VEVEKEEDEEDELLLPHQHVSTDVRMCSPSSVHVAPEVAGHKVRIRALSHHERFATHQMQIDTGLALLVLVHSRYVTGDGLIKC
jgi:hypothetical protein